MMIVTTPMLPGYKIVEVHGLVRGSTIRARHLGNDLVAGLRNVVGGEVKEYTTLLKQAREEALNRMIEEARKLGANAVISTSFSTAQVMQGAAEILAYGTAVNVEKE